LSNSSRLICSRLAPSIKAAINRITNNREHQISQAKLAIATANRKLENLESSLLVFQSFAEYELGLAIEQVQELIEGVILMSQYQINNQVESPVIFAAKVFVGKDSIPVRPRRGGKQVESKGVSRF